MANPNEFSQPASYLNGGPFETTWGPYATKEEACLALKNEVDADGKNRRMGKTVAIGTVTDYVEHAWTGGFDDRNLKPKLDKPIIDILENTVGSLETVDLITELFSIASGAYLYTTVQVAGNTFSGYGWPIGSPQNFNRLIFRLRPRSTPITSIVCVLRETNKSGTILASKSMHVTTAANTAFSVQCFFDEVILNNADSNLYFMFAADQPCEVLGKTTAIIFPSPTYGMVSTISGNSTDFNSAFNVTSQIDVWSKIERLESTISPSSSFSEKVAANSETIQTAIVNTSTITPMVKDSFLPGQDIKNPIESISETSATFITGDSGSQFYGWGSPIGIRNNFNAVMLKVQNRPSNSSPITKLNCYITEVSKNGNVVGSKEITGLNIAPGASQYIVVSFPTTIENQSNSQLYITYRTDQTLWFYGKINDTTNYPYPSFSAYSYASAGNTTPNTFATGYEPAVNQRNVWCKVGMLKTLAIPTQDLVDQLNLVIAPKEQPPIYALANKLYISTGDQIELYYQNILKYHDRFKGRSDIEFTAVAGMTQKMTGRAAKMIRSSVGTVAGGLSIGDDKFVRVVPYKAFSVIVSSKMAVNPVAINVFGDSYDKEMAYLNPIVTSSANTGITWVGIRRAGAYTSSPSLRTEGMGGWTLANFFTLNRNVYNRTMQPAGAYLYYGNTSFWINANSGSPSYDTMDFTSVRGQFNATTGYKITPNVNDVLYDNALTKFVYWNGSSWVDITESELSFSFNYAKYLQAWGLSTPNILYLKFGTNDYASANEIEAEAAFPLWKSRMDIWISQAKAVSSTMKILIVIPNASGKQGVDGTYTTERRNRAFWIHKKNVLAEYQGKEATNVYVLDLHTCIDREFGFWEAEELPFAEYTGTYRERYMTDTVHLSTGGHNQMGKLLLGVIQYLRQL